MIINVFSSVYQFENFHFQNNCQPEPVEGGYTKITGFDMLNLTFL